MSDKNAICKKVLKNFFKQSHVEMCWKYPSEMDKSFLNMGLEHVVNWLTNSSKCGYISVFTATLLH